jgi:catechol 2,3-dioxygenase-like lactoylglutathione lyase family enzyme
MIDHVSLAVRDLDASVRFYRAVLEPLGMRPIKERAGRVGFGSKYPELWLNVRPSMPPIPDDTGAHICLRARTTDAVDAFHRLALANGGSDDGAPGLRTATMVTYYAAFIRDPDGNRIEVMTVPASEPGAA